MPNAISIELIEEQVDSWSREYVRPAFLGDIEAAGRLSVALNGTEVAALLPAGQPVPEPGATVGLAFDPAALHVMEGEG